jgi:type II secretory pathway component PulF
MEEQFDARAMMERVGEVTKEFRKSEVYPVVVAGIVGGIAGALMATIIAGRRSPPKPSPAKDEAQQAKGWSIRDLVQLLTVLATLARQVQAWMKEQKKA